MKKKQEMKIKYVYVKPENETERVEQECRVQSAYDLLFEVTLQNDGWKQYKAKQRRGA